MALNATTSSAGQSATQSPQSATGSTVGGTQTDTVQTGTPSNLLNSRQNGISLNDTALTTVNLSPRAASTTASVPLASPAKHHINGVLLGLSALLIIVAVVLFGLAGRSVKSTT